MLQYLNHLNPFFSRLYPVTFWSTCYETTLVRNPFSEILFLTASDIQLWRIYYSAKHLYGKILLIAIFKIQSFHIQNVLWKEKRREKGDDEKVHQKRARNHLLSDGWISRERDFEVFVTVSRASPDSFLSPRIEVAVPFFSCTPFFCAIVLQAYSSAFLGPEDMNASERKMLKYFWGSEIALFAVRLVTSEDLYRFYSIYKVKGIFRKMCFVWSPSLPPFLYGDFYT